MANGIFTVCVNRVGPGGCATPETAGVPADKLAFCGGSFVTDPYGNVVEQAAFEKEDLALITIKPDDILRARRRRPYFRDRRPETYAKLSAI
jgi:N-carbamoylputrescine amidase